MQISTEIIRDSRYCGGEPIFRGTRVLLRTVLASLAEGDTEDEIQSDFPTLTSEHLRAAISFAAASAKEDMPVHGIPIVA